MGYVGSGDHADSGDARLVFPTQRGGSVKPVTHATAERVEDRWAQLTSPEELEALRASLLRLLTELKVE